MLPNHLIFVRHGESEGNVAMAAAKNGDLSHFNESYVNTPGRKWGLSPVGEKQAQAMGEWLRSEDEAGAFGDVNGPRRHYASPLTRTRHTAAHLGLTDSTGASVEWRLNRALRERDWGDIETMTKSAYREAYPDSALKEKIDPLYWRPPGGESIADVAGNRVLSFYDTLHRECSEQTVFAVTHGERIRADLLTITRANDEDYWIWDEGFPTDNSEILPAAPNHDYSSQLANLFGGKLKIPNCATFHLSRFAPDSDPAGPDATPRMAYLRIAAPVKDSHGNWVGEVTQDWTEFELKLFTNDDLLAF